MSEIYSVLLTWAVALSGYQPPALPLEVVTVSSSALEQKACHATPCQTLAWYPEAGGTRVFLDDRLSPDANVADASIVVREFVRYLQWSAGKRDHAGDCESGLKLDREAYVVQQKFLAANGARFTVTRSILSASCA
ncbi:MAG: hypothetical protein HYU77_02950 [Betaproteobacteria bacterium]|nr:hypothetical protein [Betaproteobacteria bacterium]